MLLVFNRSQEKTVSRTHASIMIRSSQYHCPNLQNRVINLPNTRTVANIKVTVTPMKIALLRAWGPSPSRNMMASGTPVNVKKLKARGQLKWMSSFFQTRKFYCHFLQSNSGAFTLNC